MALNLKMAFPLLSTIKVCKEKRKKNGKHSEKKNTFFKYNQLHPVNKTNINKSTECKYNPQTAVQRNSTAAVSRIFTRMRV